MSDASDHSMSERHPERCECSTCGPSALADRTAPRLRTIRVRARGEDVRVVQVQGNLFVCSPAHGNCCCGRLEKGRAAVNQALYEAEWERRRLRNRLHLSFTGCLGPCAAGNNALLLLLGQAIWLKDLNDDALVPAIFDYADAMLAAGQALPPPPALREHVYERYRPLAEQAGASSVADGGADDGGLERLDPVCLMDVDPSTARYLIEYRGRVIYFCAPSCKRAFEQDPSAYLA